MGCAYARDPGGLKEEPQPETLWHAGHALRRALEDFVSYSLTLVIQEGSRKNHSPKPFGMRGMPKRFLSSSSLKHSLARRKQKTLEDFVLRVSVCGRTRIRTADPLLVRQML